MGAAAGTVPAPSRPLRGDCERETAPPRPPLGGGRSRWRQEAMPRQHLHGHQRGWSHTGSASTRNAAMAVRNGGAAARGYFLMGHFGLIFLPDTKRFQDSERFDSAPAYAKVESAGRPLVQFAASSKTKDRTSLIVFTLATVCTPVAERENECSEATESASLGPASAPLSASAADSADEADAGSVAATWRRTGAAFGVQRSLTAAVQPPFSDNTTCSTSSRMKSSTRDGGHP